jgi:hypothetical protein
VRQLTTLILLLAGGVVTAEAQSMRPFTTFRQVHGEVRVAAQLEYAAGLLRVIPGRPTELYRMDLTYDEDRFFPLSDFNSQRGTLILGVKPVGEAGVRVVSRNQLQQAATVALSPQVALALSLKLGAADADLDLGGLKVSQIDMNTGASKTVVRFSRPNATRCDHAAISAGAAQVSVLGLGNSRCDEINFEGGVGKVLLDFSGAWTSSARVQVTMAMGELTLRLPQNAGVRIIMDKFLASFEPKGLVRRGEAYQSPNYDTSQRHLDLDLTTAMGGVNVEWVRD